MLNHALRKLKSPPSINHAKIWPMCLGISTPARISQLGRAPPESRCSHLTRVLERSPNHFSVNIGGTIQRCPCPAEAFLPGIKRSQEKTHAMDSARGRSLVKERATCLTNAHECIRDDFEKQFSQSKSVGRSNLTFVTI